MAQNKKTLRIQIQKMKLYLAITINYRLRQSWRMLVSIKMKIMKQHE